MKGDIDSLNASVAAGVLAFEIDVYKRQLNSYENQIPIDYACGWALSSDDMSCTMQMLLEDVYKRQSICIGCSFFIFWR